MPAVTGPATIEVILDPTPFYAEAGGQLADQGEILSDDGAVLEVDDVQKPINDLIVHQCRLTEGTLVVGAEVNANIDLARRGAIARSTPPRTWCTRRCARSSARRPPSVVPRTPRTVCASTSSGPRPRRSP